MIPKQYPSSALVSYFMLQVIHINPFKSNIPFILPENIRDSEMGT